jgi:hypothetical protein
VVNENTSARLNALQTIFRTGGEKSPDPARIAAAGNGVDDLVKVDGQWLIKCRNVAAADDK